MKRIFIDERMRENAKFGGLSPAAVFVSVVLSLPLRAVAVSDYPALCCPDFPLVNKRLSFKLSVIVSYT